MNKNTVGMILALTSAAIFITYFGVINIAVLESIAISLAGLFAILVALIVLAKLFYCIYEDVNTYKTNKSIDNKINKDKAERKSDAEIVSEATITLAEIFLNNKKDKPCK